MAKDMSIAMLYDFYGDMLTEKQQEMIELYYNEDLSLAEIASHSGISRQGVRDAIKRGEYQLAQFEDCLGLVARFGRMGQVLREIARQADLIEAHNDRYVYSREISRAADRIRELSNKLIEDHERGADI